MFKKIFAFLSVVCVAFLSLGCSSAIGASYRSQSAACDTGNVQARQSASRASVGAPDWFDYVFGDNSYSFLSVDELQLQNIAVNTSVYTASTSDFSNIDFDFSINYPCCLGVINLSFIDFLCQDTSVENPYILGVSLNSTTAASYDHTSRFSLDPASVSSLLKGSFSGFGSGDFGTNRVSLVTDSTLSPGLNNINSAFTHSISASYLPCIPGRTTTAMATAYFKNSLYAFVPFQIECSKNFRLANCLGYSLYWDSTAPFGNNFPAGSVAMDGAYQIRFFTAVKYEYCTIYFPFNSTFSNTLSFDLSATTSYYFSTFSYDNGYTAGYSDGKVAGQDAGYDRGYAEGNSNGYSDGYRIGGESGYNTGYNAGVASANKYSFLGLIGAVIDAPISAFRGLLDFEVLGVNLSTFALSLITFSIIIKIIGLVLGNG